MRLWLEQRLAAGDPEGDELVAQSVRQLAPEIMKILTIARFHDKPDVDITVGPMPEL